MKILNFGSLNLDYVYQTEHFVRAGETLASTGYAVYLGGKGLNQSIALARSGASVYHAGCIGDNGGALLDSLNANEVNTQFLRRGEGPNGHAVIQVNPHGENGILLYGGSNQQITAEQIDDTISHFEKGDILLLQNEINNIPYLIEAAHARGLTIALNPSPWSSSIEAWPLSYIQYFLVNEIEGAALAGLSEDSSPSNILDAIRHRYPQSTVILTLGSKGVCYDDGRQRLTHPIFQVPVVDTTAAGDTFTGYFLSSVCRGEAPENALRIASCASSIAVSRNGASPSIPYLSEVTARLCK